MITNGKMHVATDTLNVSSASALWNLYTGLCGIKVHEFTLTQGRYENAAEEEMWQIQLIRNGGATGSPIALSELKLDEGDFVSSTNAVFGGNDLTGDVLWEVYWNIRAPLQVKFPPERRPIIYGTITQGIGCQLKTAPQASTAIGFQVIWEELG